MVDVFLSCFSRDIWCSSHLINTAPVLINLQTLVLRLQVGGGSLQLVRLLIQDSITLLDHRLISDLAREWPGLLVPLYREALNMAGFPLIFL